MRFTSFHAYVSVGLVLLTILVLTSSLSLNTDKIALASIKSIRDINIIAYPHGSNTPLDLFQVQKETVSVLSSQPVLKSDEENFHGRTLPTPFGSRMDLSLSIDGVELSFALNPDTSVFDETSRVIVQGGDSDDVRTYQPTLVSYRGTAFAPDGQEFRALMTVTPSLVMESASQTLSHQSLSAAPSHLMSEYTLQGAIIDANGEMYQLSTYFPLLARSRQESSQIASVAAQRQESFRYALAALSLGDETAQQMFALANAEAAVSGPHRSMAMEESQTIRTQFGNVVSLLEAHSELNDAYTLYTTALTQLREAEDYHQTLQSMSSDQLQQSPYNLAMYRFSDVHQSHTHAVQEEQPCDNVDQDIVVNADDSPFQTLSVLKSWSNCHGHQAIPSIRRTRVSLRIVADYSYGLFASGYTYIPGEQNSSFPPVRKEAVAMYAASTMQIVNNVYESLIQVVLSIKVLHLYEQQTNDAWNYGPGDCDTSGILDNFKNYITPATRDTGITHLFTACDVRQGQSSYTVGVANYAGVCRANNQSVGGWSNLSYGTWTTVAHEIGHNHSLDHTFAGGRPDQKPQGSGMGIMDYNNNRLVNPDIQNDPNFGQVAFSVFSDSERLCLLYDRLFDPDDEVYRSSPWAYQNPTFRSDMVPRAQCYSVEYNSNALCGNGVVDPGEECDNGSTPSSCCVGCRFTQGSTCDPNNTFSGCCVNCQNHVGSCGDNGGFCDLNGKCRTMAASPTCVPCAGVTPRLSSSCIVPCQNPASQNACSLYSSLNRLERGAACILSDNVSLGVCDYPADSNTSTLQCSPPQYTWTLRPLQTGCNCEESVFYTMSAAQCMNQAGVLVASSYCNSSTRPADVINWCNCFAKDDVNHVTYEWGNTSYTPCSAECGQGTKTLLSEPTCTRRLKDDAFYFEVVEDSLCAGSKPPEVASCEAPEWNCGTRDTSDLGYTCVESKCVCRNDFAGELCRLSPQLENVRYSNSDATVYTAGGRAPVRWDFYGGDDVTINAYVHTFDLQGHPLTIRAAREVDATSGLAWITIPLIHPDKPATLSIGPNRLFMTTIPLAPVRPVCQAPTEEEMGNRTYLDCGEHGTCDIYTNACKCAKGYTGSACEKEITCDTLNCHENSECVVQSGVAQCQCHAGHTGPTCATDICASLQCTRLDKEAVCSGETGYSCQCSAHYYGATCQHSYEEDCLSQYKSIRIDGEFIDFSANVEYVIDEATSTGQCRCKDGWSGKFCHVVADCPKASGDALCKNGATFVDEDCTDATCQCINYWSSDTSPMVVISTISQNVAHAIGTSEASTVNTLADGSCDVCSLACESPYARRAGAECTECQCNEGYFSPECTCPEIYVRLVLSLLPQEFRTSSFTPSQVYTNWNVPYARNHLPGFSASKTNVNEFFTLLTPAQLKWWTDALRVLDRAANSDDYKGMSFLPIRMRFIPDKKDSISGKFILELAFRAACDAMTQGASPALTIASNDNAVLSLADDIAVARQTLTDRWEHIRTHIATGSQTFYSGAPFNVFTPPFSTSYSASPAEYGSFVLAREAFDPNCVDKTDEHGNITELCPQGYNPAKRSSQDPDLPSSGGGLSTTNLIIIIVVCVVVVLIAAGILLFCLLRRRGTTSSSTELGKM